MTAPDSSSNNSDSSLNPQSLFRRLIKIVANLRLAIVLLLSIALVSILGTVIEQKETLQFYQQNYPEDPALFGFLSWKVILILGLNHVFTTWWYLSLLVIFGTSLAACTFTRQLPALKAARNWKFYDRPRQFEKLALAAELKTGSLEVLTPLLQEKGYKIFSENNALYARKGIIGRIGPIVVHAGILVILVGGIWGAFTGFLAQEMIPSGATFKIQNIFEAGRLSDPQIPQDWAVKVNRFWIEYTAKGDIDQFYSDLSIVDENGAELKRETIHVNQPLRYDGVTLYQTNWGIAAVQVQLNNSPIFQLPMAKLDSLGGNIWGTWIPLKPDLSAGVSLLARDLQGTVFIYNATGELVGAIRSDMGGVEIDGIKLKLVKLIGSTGLQIKADPGVPIVYAGFALLMSGVIMSYFSHSQIWALKIGDRFYLGGRTNRARVSFERELIAIFDSFDGREQTPSTSTEIPV